MKNVENCPNNLPTQMRINATCGCGVILHFMLWYASFVVCHAGKLYRIFNGAPLLELIPGSI